MQGFIHLLLEAYVSETIGAQHLRQIRRMAGVEGPPLITQHYPDQITTNLFQAIAEYESVLLDDLLYHFGAYFLQAPPMRHHYGAYLEGHTSARSFLEQVPTMHHHLQQALPESRFPDLRCIPHSPELMEIIYASPRQLCRFLQGILDGVGRYFQEPLEVREMECQQRGAAACRILVRFLPTRRTGPQPGFPSQASAAGTQTRSGALAHAPTPSMEGADRAEAKRQREGEEDLLVLQALSSRQTTASHPLASGSAHDQPLNLALSLFEIAQWLTTRGAPGEQTRLSLIQRSLTRLAMQGFVESKLDPQAIRQNASPGVAALGGQGILAAQRYSITPAGQAWLSDMQRHRQEY